MAAAVPVRVAVLGPLELRVQGVGVAVPGLRRSAVLAVLALAAGRTVTTDLLTDALWGDRVPEGGVQALHSQISRLRKTLGSAAERVERVAGGYRLRLEPDELDVDQARRLAAEATALAGSNPRAAADRAGAALALWRGEALAEFGEIAPLTAYQVGLTQLYEDLRDLWWESRLAAGDHTVAAEAATALVADPIRERTAVVHVRALAAAGRSAEAMRAAGSFRTQLAEETGLDPGPGFAALEQQVASGALAPPARPARRPLVRPRTPLVGRSRDRDELHRLLSRFPVVTVAGPGGVGKTRIVLEVAADAAEREPDRVAWVPLAAVTEPARVPEAVVSALGLRVSGHPSAASVADALAGQQLLLVLDNCEHVATGCRKLVTVLGERAPDVRVLATSRTTLHVPGEYVVRLQPLPMPLPIPGGELSAGDLRDLGRQPAVRAFVEHAERRVGGFEVTRQNAALIIDVLHRLDGLPLAIELAAGQLAVLPLPALGQRLGRALDVLVAERPDDQARQRTLRATVDWSYRLLGEPERRLLRSLAPFPGGVELATVEEIAGQVLPDGSDPLVSLSRLVDASLLAVDSQSAARYSLLDTVRSFLLGELERSGERADADRRFVRWAVAATRGLAGQLYSEQEGDGDRGLRAELANLRAALDLAVAGHDLDSAVEIDLAVDTATVFRDLPAVWGWAVELAAHPGLSGHRRQVSVLGSAAMASWLFGDHDEARRLSRAALARADDATSDSELSRAWNAIAAVALFSGEFDEATRAYQRAAAGALDPASELAAAALSAGYGGDRVRAERLLDQASALPACPSSRAFTLYTTAEIAADPGAAIEAYRESIALARSCGATFVVGVSALGLARQQAELGEVQAAAETYAQLIAAWQASGNLTQLWTTVRNAALLLHRTGADEGSALLLAAADGARGLRRWPVIPAWPSPPRAPS